MTIPPPPPAFRWTEEPWGHALRCSPLSVIAPHVFTTRQLGLRGGSEPPGDWEAVRDSVGGDRLARARQVHGREVWMLRRGEALPDDLARRPEADAIVTDVPGLAVAVQMADCVPLLMADARTGVVAAVHSGWRGACANVTAATVRAMAGAFGTRPEDLLAAIGPAIGPCCYEVGAEVLLRFEAAHHPSGALAHWFTRVADGADPARESLRLDVTRIVRDQLAAAGVLPERTFVCAFCTKCHSDVFESYRGEGARAGRMAAAIAIRR
jgi:YfiH family protein